MKWNRIERYIYHYFYLVGKDVHLRKYAQSFFLEHFAFFIVFQILSQRIKLVKNGCEKGSFFIETTVEYYNRKDSPSHLFLTDFCHLALLLGTQWFESIGASGNGGYYGDNCGADGNVNNVYSIAVASAARDHRLVIQ